MREFRRGLAEVRQVTDEGGVRAVTLHCIRPGVVDDYGSVWMAGTFDESIRERLPTLVWAHDWTEPLGRGVDFRLGDDGPEVIFEFDNFDDVPIARRAFAQVRSGTIQDCSVGFSNTQRRDPTEEEVQRWPGVREVIEKATLDEVSLVLRGAVPGAKVLAVRAGGGTVAEEHVIALARKMADGELTEAEAKAALALLAEPDGGDKSDPAEPDPQEEAGGEEQPEDPPPPAADTLEAEMDEALALIERSR